MGLGHMQGGNAGGHHGTILAMVHNPLRLGSEYGSEASIYVCVCWKFSRVRNKKNGDMVKLFPKELFPNVKATCVPCNKHR